MCNVYLKFPVVWLVLTLSAFCGCNNAPGTDLISPGNTTYFIDPAGGNDENSGLGADRAWKTFSHLSRLKLSPGDIPTRGFLLSTRRKVIVEENEFLATYMNAILMSIDANNWYESGYVRDMTIRNNRFIKCAEPVILIEPGNIIANNNVYQNVRIENNEFILHEQGVLKAKSTKNLIVEGNTVYAEKRLYDQMSIITEDCAGVTIARNRYMPLPEAYSVRKQK